MSVRAVMQALGLGLDELDDWNCCGATEYFTQDRLTASAVIARNLALAQNQCAELVAPCAACYLNLKKTDRLMAEDATTNGRINAALAAGGLSYRPGTVRVRHLLDLLYDDVGPVRLQEKIVQPLTGLRIAPYYGCQVVRPTDGLDDPEYPTRMDELCGWLGAEVVDYPVKAHCCGGHMTQISEAQSLELIRRLLQSATDYRSDLILCMCPMCQLNLDLYQGRVNNDFNVEFRLPIVFFTQIVGVALGIELKQLGFGKEIVPAEPVLRLRLREAGTRATS
jgi:heterodisulfide reductase subunit B